MIYNIYIFAREHCLYYEEWNRTNNPKDLDTDAEKKLVWGCVVTLKSISSQLSPTTPSPIQTFNSFATPTYRMHILETPTGYRFVVNTDPQCLNMKDVLSHIYRILFLRLVVKNPSWQAPQSCPSTFAQQLKSYIQKRPEFTSFGKK